MSVFVPFCLQDRVHVEGRYINRNARETVVNKLKNGIEGICSKHGLIRTGSVGVRFISLGILSAENGGGATFNVTFDAEVCNPRIGSTVKCRVENINNIATFASNAEGDRVVEMIIPPRPQEFTHVFPYEDLQVGHVVKVCVVGKRFHLGQQKIVCAGQIASAPMSEGEIDTHVSTTEAPMTSHLSSANDILTRDTPPRVLAGDADSEVHGGDDEDEEQDDVEDDADVDEEIDIETVCDTVGDEDNAALDDIDDAVDAEE